MSLKYEPASVPQHISVKWLFLNLSHCADDRDLPDARLGQRRARPQQPRAGAPRPPLSHTLALTLTLSPTLALTLTLSPTLALTLTLSHTLALTLTLSPTLALTLTLTHSSSDATTTRGCVAPPVAHDEAHNLYPERAPSRLRSDQSNSIVEQQYPQGVFVCDHAGLVINKFSCFR